MVHILDTDSWPEVPSSPLRGETVFTHGCLHWLACGKRKIIWFHVRKEEFRSFDTPKMKQCLIYKVKLILLESYDSKQLQQVCIY